MIDCFPSSLIIFGGSTRTSSGDRRVLCAISPSGEFSNVVGKGNRDVCDGNLQARHLFTFNDFFIVLLNASSQSDRNTIRRMRAYRQDTPMEFLLQVGSDFSRLECADLVLSETITKCTSQWNRSSDDLVLLCCIAATLATSEIWGEQSV